jgi:hypothetical protein
MGQGKRLALQLSLTENLKREGINRADLIIAHRNLINVEISQDGIAPPG